MDNNNITENQRIVELANENRELKELLKYYYGAEQLLDQANEILDRAIESEAELEYKAEEIDTIAFEQNAALKKREAGIEKKENELKKTLHDAHKKEKHAQEFIDLKLKEKIAEHRRICFFLVMGITFVYTFISIMIYLFL